MQIFIQAWHWLQYGLDLWASSIAGYPELEDESYLFDEPKEQINGF